MWLLDDGLTRNLQNLGVPRRMCYKYAILGKLVSKASQVKASRAFCVHAGVTMFGMLESLAKAAVGVVTVPAAVVADVVTLGGSLTDKDRPYTADAVSDVVQNLENATDPRR